MRCTELDDNDIAMLVDWVRGIGQKPPLTIMVHLEKCYECKLMVLEIAEMMDEVDGNIGVQRGIN
jgi:hypothetical protein